MYECEVHDVKIVYYVVLSFLYICPYVLFRTALFNKDKVQYDQSPEFKFRFVFSPFNYCVSQLSVDRFGKKF